MDEEIKHVTWSDPLKEYIPVKVFGEHRDDVLVCVVYIPLFAGFIEQPCFLNKKEVFKKSELETFHKEINDITK